MKTPKRKVIAQWHIYVGDLPMAFGPVFKDQLPHEVDSTVNGMVKAYESIPGNKGNVSFKIKTL